MDHASAGGKLFRQTQKNLLILPRCVRPSPVFSFSNRQTLLATQQELSDFLAEIERRAYKQALFAVRDEHLALDVVQDSMTKLVENYSAKPSEELPLLFQRILQNTIRDFYRRQKTRSLWTTLFSSFLPRNQEKENEDYDPLETLRAGWALQFC